MRAKPKVTIADVAKLAGVSTATAGRVLGEYGYSSAEKRGRVLAAAKSLNYRPNLLARSLITGRTRTIGVVAGDIQSPFYATILRGVSDVAGRNDFGLLITNSDESAAEEIRAVELLLEKQVDGLIVSPCDTHDAAHLRDTAANLPVVLIDREVAGLEVDTVGVDNIGSTQDCIADLIRLGHRRIGMVAELESSYRGGVADFIDRARASAIEPAILYPSWQRLLGYLRAHDAAGVPVDPGLVCRVGKYSVQAAQDQARLFLAQGPRPTAIFTADGLMSAGTMAAISASHLQVPGDLSLVCFDDLDWMAFVDSGIDAVAQPRSAMGEAAARMLLERIDGLTAPPRRLKLATRHITRGSVKPNTPEGPDRPGAKQGSAPPATS